MVRDKIGIPPFLLKSFHSVSISMKMLFHGIIILLVEFGNQNKCEKMKTNRKKLKNEKYCGLFDSKVGQEVYKMPVALAKGCFAIDLCLKRLKIGLQNVRIPEV